MAPRMAARSSPTFDRAPGGAGELEVAGPRDSPGSKLPGRGASRAPALILRSAVYETISDTITQVSPATPDTGVTDTHPARVSTVSIGDLEARIRRYNSDLEKDSVTFRVAVILLAGLEYGHNIDRISRRTGCERAFVARVARRLTDNGVWNAGVTVADWSSTDEASGTFWNDVAVAEGKMCRRIGPTGQIEWAPAGFWNKSFHYVEQEDDAGLSTLYLDAGENVDKLEEDGVDKSDENDAGEPSIGEDEDTGSPETDVSIGDGSSQSQPVDNTEVVGPVPGAARAVPVSGPRSVPPLDDLFRDVVWIG
jgi:hypothetical protein